MRILFTTFAWPSHYFAQVPLAWACRAAGHEVRMTSQPELERVMLASGLPLRYLHKADADEVEIVGRVALAEDHVTRVEAD